MERRKEGKGIHVRMLRERLTNWGGEDVTSDFTSRIGVKP